MQYKQQGGVFAICVAGEQSKQQSAHKDQFGKRSLNRKEKRQWEGTCCKAPCVETADVRGRPAADQPKAEELSGHLGEKICFVKQR
jgi:hypothetical protein